MMMEEGLDTGPVLSMESIATAGETTAGELHDALAELGGRMIVSALEEHAAGAITPQPQVDAEATYAKKIDKSEARIDWSEDSTGRPTAHQCFCAMAGVVRSLAGERIKVLAAETVDASGAKGETLDDDLTVACGNGALRLVRLQREGKRPVAAADFLRGRPVHRGTQFQ